MYILVRIFKKVPSLWEANQNNYCNKDKIHIITTRFTLLEIFHDFIDLLF